MGAFDSDKTLGRGEILTESFEVGDEFILWDSEYLGEIHIPNSDLGDTDKCVLSISEKLTPDERKEYSVIGATATKLKELTAEELPAVCKIISFTSKTYGTEGRTVQWVRNWTQAEADSLHVPFDREQATA